MSTRAQALQTADGGPLDLQAVIAALTPAFGVATGAKEVIRRTSLDTFDRRLRAVGITLAHHRTTSEERLVLAGPAATSTVVLPVSGLRWPAHADALPAGYVRDTIAAVTGIRALLVISDEKRRLRRVELRDKELKTVARLELDEPAGASSTCPAGITVRALRGYDAQAQRAVRLLSESGLRSVDGDPAGQADGRPPAAVLDRDAPATDLLASVLTDFATAMRENLPGLLADVDTEFLHDFRVAVRRTRSTLKLGRPALPEIMHSQWEPAFKWLGDLTTPVRDLDVYELELPTMAGWLVAADAADLEPFALHLRRRRGAERRKLVRGLRSARFQRHVIEWDEALVRLADSPDGSQVSAGELAGSSISRAYRRVLRVGTAITAESPGEDLHTLRKRCKELRYALEVFAPVVDRGQSKRAVSELKVLQDVLGRYQDSEVQRHSMREFAEEMMAGQVPAGVLLAMGELIGHLDAEQDRARGEFDSTFGHFVRPAGTRRMKRLGGGT